MRSWIKAGTELSRDPTLKVPCPDCDRGHLLVTDVYNAGTDIVERVLRCSECGSSNSIRMIHKPSRSRPSVEVERPTARSAS